MTNTAPFATIFIFSLALILQLTFVLMPAWAQEETRPKKGTLEIGFGVSTLGPTWQMATLMKKYNLDGSHMTIFLNKRQYPRYQWLGSEFHLAYFRQIAEGRRLGITFNSLERGAVSGYSAAGNGLLKIRFSQGSIALLYRHQLDKQFDFEAGPAIVFNDATTDTNEDDSQDYTAVSPGLKLGFNMKILDLKKSNLKSDIKFIYSGSHTMGPFSANSDYGPITIPKKKLWFNFLRIGLIWGISI